MTNEKQKEEARMKKEVEKFVDEEFKAFEKLCPRGQDPVLSILRLHLLVEYHLERIFHLCLARGDKISSESFSFAHKLSLVEALDVLDDRTVQSLKNLNRVRNRCAHEFDKTITASDIELIGRPLGKEHTKIKNDAGSDQQEYLFNILGCVCGNVVAMVFAHEQRVCSESGK